MASDNGVEVRRYKKSKTHRFDSRHLKERQDTMATLKDIATKTGFSVTTISRALNGYPDVNLNTRDIINQAAKELNYSPNIIARSLVMKQSKIIGFIIADLKKESAKDSFMFNSLCGISDSLSSTDYEFVLLGAPTSKQHTKTYQQVCAQRQLDGVIIQGFQADDPYLQEIVGSDIPCVLFDMPMDGKNIGCVTSNHTESTTNAVKYLCHMNHKHIAYVDGAPGVYVSEMRKKGYEIALAEAGIKVREEYIVNGCFSERMAKQAIIPLLLKHPEITAVFCASDLMALGVMQAARKLELQVPKQLSIIGFDNIILSEYVTPPLTTVGQSPYDLAVAATKMVINLIEGKKTHSFIETKNELIIRDSVAFNHIVP
jgi:LacI family transcriptional regulator/LacI family purine nucleotide synthesis repressor